MLKLVFYVHDANLDGPTYCTVNPALNCGLEKIDFAEIQVHRLREEEDRAPLSCHSIWAKRRQTVAITRSRSWSSAAMVNSKMKRQQTRSPATISTRSSFMQTLVWNIPQVPNAQHFFLIQVFSPQHWTYCTRASNNQTRKFKIRSVSKIRAKFCVTRDLCHFLWPPSHDGFKECEESFAEGPLSGQETSQISPTDSGKSQLMESHLTSASTQRLLLSVLSMVEMTAATARSQQEQSLKERGNHRILKAQSTKFPTVSPCLF